MAVRELTGDEITALVGMRHESAGFEYAAGGLQPYYEWLMRSLHLLGESAAGELRVARDESGEARVWIAPGRAVVDGRAWLLDGQVVELATLNNETAYVWAEVVSEQLVVAADVAANGWPANAHIKLAEVVIEAGQVTSIIDRRGEGRLSDAHTRFGYVMAIESQGDVATPSTVHIELVDAQGERVKLVDYLRVRVTDVGHPGTSTAATIGPTGSTTVIETVTTDKDLVLKSDAQGRYELLLTHDQVATAVVRLGVAPVGGRIADWSKSLAVAHA